MKVNLQLTHSAKEAISKEIVDCALRSPIPALIWGKRGDEAQDHWMVACYERDEIRLGWFLETPELEFYTYQDWLVKTLNGKVLDYVDNKFKVI